uniref:G-patch_2 domain-containing protein n=1 Tax=Glossina brevipalpis TaxID=37001 RepID=A0A1A9WLU8_9MUSC
MEQKKISFGFSKVDKKLNLLPKTITPKSGTKVELIKCLEGQKIKLIEKKEKEAPLIIPVRENEITSKALASLKKRRAVLLGEQDSEELRNGNISNHENHANETLEQRAARELLQAVQGKDSQYITSNLILPIVKPEDLPLEGAKVSTLDDYESVPIQEFGKAMLRGMGWTEPAKFSKNKSLSDETQLIRPKGMGLGVEKVLKSKPLLVPPENNEVLEIKRNAFVRILAGKHKDLYGQIEGFDDHAGRIIVKMAIGGLNQTFNEFLCQPVSRKEYAQYGKCINNAEYEKYKSKENESVQRAEKKRESERAHSQGDTDYKSQSSSHWHNKPSITSDSSKSTKTDSNSDSAYEQQSRKKSDRKQKKKKIKKLKKKKSKHSKNRYNEMDSSSPNTVDTDSESEDNEKRKKHKKKSKKSKKHRERSRSRDKK